MFSGVNLPSWAQLPLSGQLLVIGGALLLFACALIAFRRKQRVALERSLLSDEVTIYLARIADALERIAARPASAASDQLLEQIGARLTVQREEHGENAGTKGHSIPYSMLGREY